MAYKGTTEATSLQNPPVRVGGGLISQTRVGSTTTPIGNGLWMYNSTDTTTAAFGAGYFTDGYNLGMRQGDIVFLSGLTSTVSSSVSLLIGVISSVSSTAGTAQLSTWSFISSTMA